MGSAPSVPSAASSTAAAKPHWLKGAPVAEAIQAKLKTQVEALRTRGIRPGLAVVRVGNDAASAVYVRNKVRLAEKLGLHSVDHHLPEIIDQRRLEAEIERFNADPDIDGLLCQLPLPAQLDAARITALIDPRKDVDCFHAENVGLLSQGQPRFLPCTPAGILALLDHYRIETAGRHAVILGRSHIVGSPLAVLLSQKGRDATVTLCHSRTPNLSELTRQADLLFVAIGRPGVVNGTMVKDGAVVVDVGINRVPDAQAARGYRICGDVDVDSGIEHCRALTPVPGGIGLMTVTMLLENAVRAAEQRR